MLHEFSRIESLIGKKALKKLAKSKVAVFGIGGVGSFVVEGLVRSGTGKIVLVDNDLISITNINRQLHSLTNNIGMPKVDIMEKRILEINPKAFVEKYREFYTAENSFHLIKNDYDYIVDAIDTVTSKTGLIVNAIKMGIPVISSMGTCNKLDATMFEVADIYSTSVCPLAKAMRRELKKQGVEKLKVVYSREKPIKPKGLESNGSVSFVPSVAGLIIAGEVIKDLITTP
jgi:tRNA threonylcarbamoyladenosine dehydratase